MPRGSVTVAKMSPLPPTRERPVDARFLHGTAGLGYDDAPTQRRRGRWLRRIAMVLIISFAVMLGAIAAVAFYTKGQIDDLVTPRSAAMRKAQGELTAPLPGKPANILLLGSDHRKSTSSDATDRRSDTLLLVRLDPKRKTISMLSFPRDLYVPIPGHGTAKLNEAYQVGGPALSVKTIKDLTDLDINFVMNVDFTGFRGVVDQLGGVWVDVDRTYFNDQSDQVSDIDIKPGYQLMNGKDALAYARFRHDNRGDFNRIARQQQVIAGLKKQVGGSSLAKNVPGLFRVFHDNTEVVQGGGDSVDARVLYGYLRLALKLDGKDVYQVEYDGATGTSPAGASIVEYDEAKLDSAVQAFLAPNTKAREATADQLVGAATAATGEAATPATPTAPTEPVAPDPSTVTVTVLNGSGIAGAAKQMAEQLAAAGYQVNPSQKNADNANYASTKVIYGSAAATPAAEALAANIDAASTGAKDASNAFSTQLLVIVGKTGQTFTADGDDVVGADGGDVADSTADQYSGNVVPEKTDPNITTNAETAKPVFFDTTLKRLPILYPTVYESSSSFDEVYAYQIVRKVAGRTVIDEAYRLAASTGGGTGDTWGLQAMTWASPPILDDPTRTVTRKGRSYRLYFNGTKLHMVAWTQGIGTYWVSNSVLNNLPNETLLAIADGVKPLR